MADDVLEQMETAQQGLRHGIEKVKRLVESEQKRNLMWRGRRDPPGTGRHL